MRHIVPVKHNKKNAFTLIELLIVIAIIGILFIVLVSRVDFATDKAKASGVQTDFRSFQVALDQVAKENAGFNTFGYNAGDNAGAIPAGYSFETEELKNATIGDGIRNSYDQGDKNLNGKQDGTEVFTGRKIYTETWTEVYTLTKPGTTGLDANAVFALESAINANLDPKLHISINATDGIITMANQARDPWKNEYHGVYISKAERDNGADRGAIIIYSNGANGQHGSEHDITNGVVTVTVPGNNTYGKDDYSLVSCYTFVNGYGEVLNMSTGFSNNQSFLGATNNIPPVVIPGENNNGNNITPGGGETPNVPSEPAGPGEGGYQMLSGSEVTVTKGDAVMFRSEADSSDFVELRIDGQKMDSYYYGYTSGSTIVTVRGATIDSLGKGEHDVEIVSIDGSAKAKLYINYECRMDHHMIYEQYGTICPECETFSCDASCSDSIDDGMCRCDWCGMGGYMIHIDEDENGFCEKCGMVFCGYSSEGNHHDLTGDCICDCCEWMPAHPDANNDDLCDNCHIRSCFGSYPCFSSDDDCYCDCCDRYVVHLDTDLNNRCDRCSRIVEHQDSNKDCICDTCDIEMGHPNTDYDAFCDRCGLELDHYDTDYNFVCDGCGAIVYCYNNGGIMNCHSSDDNCFCDSCGDSYDCHTDYADRNGYCDDCNELLCCRLGGSCVDTYGDHKCNFCNAYIHVDDNNDAICDECSRRVCKDSDNFNKDCYSSWYNSRCKCYYCGQEAHSDSDYDNDCLCDYCNEDIHAHCDLTPIDGRCDICDEPKCYWPGIDCCYLDPHDYYCNYCGGWSDYGSDCVDNDHDGMCDITNNQEYMCHLTECCLDCYCPVCDTYYEYGFCSDWDGDGFCNRCGEPW